MSDITWGPEILVGGVRPAWLGDDVQYLPKSDRSGWWAERSEAERRPGWLTWPNITAIRLPADHFAYVAISKGYIPWGGDTAPPDDWDGGDVLMRDGGAWSDPISWWTHDGGGAGKQTRSDIIGYQRTKTPANTVTLKRMTEDEAVIWAGDNRSHRYDIDGALHLPRKLNLIRQETIAERFTRETGHEVTAAVTAALAFERNIEVK